MCERICLGNGNGIRTINVTVIMICPEGSHIFVYSTIVGTGSKDKIGNKFLLWEST